MGVIKWQFGEERRKEFIELWQAGVDKDRIAELMHVPDHAVHNWSQRLKKEGAILGRPGGKKPTGKRRHFVHHIQPTDAAPGRLDVRPPRPSMFALAEFDPVVARALAERMGGQRMPSAQGDVEPEAPAD